MFAHIPDGVIERALAWVAGIALLAVLGVAGLVWLVVWLIRRSKGR